MKTRANKLNWMYLTALLAVAPLTACGDDDAGKADGDADAAPTGTFFVVPTQVYGADFATSTSYVPVVSSLDVERIDITNAREVDGRASARVIGNHLFIASSTAPIVERFTVNTDGSLTPAGEINFMAYGFADWFSIDAWGAVFVNDQKAYMFNGSDGSHIAWNPSTLEILGTIPGPGLVMEGYSLETVAVVSGTRMYRIFTFLNYETNEFLPEPQYLAVYDTETDTQVSMIEEHRCAQMYSRPFVDEQGDIYFSGWAWTVGLTLTSDYPKSCSLRVKSGTDAFDPAWQLNFAADVTGGREAGMMRYLGNGKALLDVFHNERVEINDMTDAEELTDTANWRLWQFDLATKQGAPVEGLDFKAAGYTDVPVGDRTFLLVPNGDYSETTAYQIVNGAAVPGFKIQGSSYQISQVR